MQFSFVFDKNITLSLPLLPWITFSSHSYRTVSSGRSDKSPHSRRTGRTYIDYQIIISQLFIILTLSLPQSVLQELGGKYEDTYVAAMLGQLASCKFYAGELVYTVLRFQTREYNGQMFQDILVVELIKMKN